MASLTKAIAAAAPGLSAKRIVSSPRSGIGAAPREQGIPISFQRGNHRFPSPLQCKFCEPSTERSATCHRLGQATRTGALGRDAISKCEIVDVSSCRTVTNYSSSSSSRSNRSRRCRRGLGKRSIAIADSCKSLDSRRSWTGFGYGDLRRLVPGGPGRRKNFVASIPATAEARVDKKWNRKKVSEGNEREGKSEEEEKEEEEEGVEDGDGGESKRDLEKVKGEQADEAKAEDMEDEEAGGYGGMSMEEIAREMELRQFFLESIVDGARNGDLQLSLDSYREMELAGLTPGPNAHHGVVVAYCLAEDVEGAMRALMRELGAGVQPLPQTFLAVLRLLGKKSLSHRGEEILGTMEELQYNTRLPWITLVEELQRAGDVKEANRVFLKGVESGMIGTQFMYDTLVRVNCECGNHADAVKILRNMELRGTMATTYHYNFLLLCQANSNVPQMCAITFDSMKYGRDEMKPNTESYNWLLQSWVRHGFGDCLQEMIDVLGDMIEDHKTVKPDMRTYVLIVECFVKHNKLDEAMRYFGALRRMPGSMPALHQGGQCGDPLSLYLRSACRTGKIVEMYEALEAMERDGQPIPERAMIINKYRRTMVSSWIEPMGKEGDTGIEIDYVARYVAEGGLVGTRPRWRPPISDDEDEPIPRQPDHEGFRFAAPAEESYKQSCMRDWQSFNVRLLERLLEEGAEVLGPDATEEDMKKVVQRLRIEVMGGNARNLQKPKAASKMLVAELKAELEAQGLSTEGNRPALYQRVQKARRIARARGRPIWVPPIKEEDRDEEEMVERFLLGLRERASTGDWSVKPQVSIGDEDDGELEDLEMGAEDDEIDDDDDDDEDDDTTSEGVERNRRLQKQRDEGVVDDEGEEEEEEAKDDAAVIMGVKIGGRRLLAQAAKDEKMKSEAMKQFHEEWTNLTKEEKLQHLIDQRWFDPSEAYTVADAWGWTWVAEEARKLPERWSEDLELDLAMKIMDKVEKLGGIPTASDCAVLLRSAMNAQRPDKVATLIMATHRLKHALGERIYQEAVDVCLSKGCRESAKAILTDMESLGIPVPEDMQSKVLIES